MKYELYDILTSNGKDYSICSIIVDGDFEYFLLKEIDEEEKIIANPIKIVAQPLINLGTDNRLLIIENEAEFKRVSKLLINAMIDDLKEVE